MALPNLPTAEDELGSITNGDTSDASEINELRRLLEALSLTTPRRFGTATDYVEVGAAGISFAGAARQTTIWSPTRQFLTDASGNGVGVAHRWDFIDGVTRSVYYSWGRLPNDLDVSADINFKALLFVTSAASTNLNVNFGISYYGTRVGGHIAASPYPSTIISLNGGSGTFPANEPEEHTIGTIPGGTLQAGDLLFVRVTRGGGVGGDTLAATLSMAEAPWAEYLRK